MSAFAPGDDELNMRDNELASSDVAKSRRTARSRGYWGQISEVLGNAGYCRIGELPERLTADGDYWVICA